MVQFNTEEQNLICLYDPGSRDGLIHELQTMQEFLLPDERNLRALTRRVIRKVKRMTDEEYEELEKALFQDYPLEEYYAYMEDDASSDNACSDDDYE